MENGELEKIVNELVAHVKENEGKIQALTEESKIQYAELQDLRRTQEIPIGNVTLPQKLESKTPWRQSKNPTIEWCPEQEANAHDVQLAKQGKNEMWYGEPRGNYKTGSIFIRRNA